MAENAIGQNDFVPVAANNMRPTDASPIKRVQTMGPGMMGIPPQGMMPPMMAP